MMRWTDAPTGSDLDGRPRRASPARPDARTGARRATIAFGTGLRLRGRWSAADDDRVSRPLRRLDRPRGQTHRGRGADAHGSLERWGSTRPAHDRVAERRPASAADGLSSSPTSHRSGTRTRPDASEQAGPPVLHPWGLVVAPLTSGTTGPMPRGSGDQSRRSADSHPRRRRCSGRRGAAARRRHPPPGVAREARLAAVDARSCRRWRPTSRSSPPPVPWSTAGRWAGGLGDAWPAMEATVLTQQVFGLYAALAARSVGPMGVARSPGRRVPRSRARGSSCGPGTSSHSNVSAGAHATYCFRRDRAGHPGGRRPGRQDDRVLVDARFLHAPDTRPRWSSAYRLPWRCRPSQPRGQLCARPPRRGPWSAALDDLWPGTTRAGTTPPAQ
jgi:hypothetical protein